MEQCGSLPFLLHILLFLVVEIVEAKSIPAYVFVFGDSIVDAGNNNQIPTVLRANFPPYGQDFEGNKRLVQTYLDPAYDIEDFSSGVTFASAGSGYDAATSNVIAMIHLSKELEYFKEYQKKLIAFVGQDKAIETIKESLYIVSVGTNDFLENYYFLPGRSFQFTVDEKILLLGMPPGGCLPIARTVNNFVKRTCKEDANEACKDFNDKFQNLVGNLNKELDGIILICVDIYNPVLHVIKNPELYGEFYFLMSHSPFVSYNILQMNGCSHRANCFSYIYGWWVLA
ncbi:hypothetical protein MKW98_028416 [Papaver atlanticum]|uniref:GDSL esterase/lipase n=1 Tax=Papaver atlanticum TaxID=357466 RepID=A0AAD4SXS8_9MAGN|nr:hypothetical protein MKW98_028416 [Papaver atlanticum]